MPIVFSNILIHFTIIIITINIIYKYLFLQDFSRQLQHLRVIKKFTFGKPCTYVD